ncbi:MAG: hypothetical protein M3422_23545 [Actinomycetota bacterium]|nr:hypothetical protein [Actinomycetota bacterium]
MRGAAQRGDRSRTWSIDIRGTVVDREVPSSVLSMAFTDHHAIRSPDDGGPSEVYEVRG